MGNDRFISNSVFDWNTKQSSKSQSRLHTTVISRLLGHRLVWFVSDLYFNLKASVRLRLWFARWTAILNYLQYRF
jgi:hypothetical protein